MDGYPIVIGSNFLTVNICSSEAIIVVSEMGHLSLKTFLKLSNVVL